MSAPRVADIAMAVSAATGVAVEDIRRRCKVHRVARARQETMWLARRVTDRSLTQLGRALGGLDHTTVLWSVRRVDVRLRTEPELGPRLERLAAEFRP